MLSPQRHVPRAQRLEWRAYLSVDVASPAGGPREPSIPISEAVAAARDEAIIRLLAEAEQTAQAMCQPRFARGVISRSGDPAKTIGQRDTRRRHRW